MFVKTQFETIVNLTEFEKVKIEWYKKQNTGNVFHTISAVSEEYSYRPKVGVSVDIADDVPVRTYKNTTIAQFPENMQEKAQTAYDSLFNALFQGKTAFDMTDYI